MQLIHPFPKYQISCYNLPWFPEDEAISLTGQAHGGRVDDRGDLLDVVADHLVEELLITVLEGRQVDVFVQVLPPPTDVGQHPVRLLLLGEDDRRKQAVDTHNLSLLQGERHALEEERG